MSKKKKGVANPTLTNAMRNTYLTKTEVADMIGVARPTLDKYLRDEECIPTNRLMLLSTVLRFSMGEFTRNYQISHGLEHDIINEPQELSTVEMELIANDDFNKGGLGDAEISKLFNITAKAAGGLKRRKGARGNYRIVRLEEGYWED